MYSNLNEFHLLSCTAAHFHCVCYVVQFQSKTLVPTLFIGINTNYLVNVDVLTSYNMYKIEFYSELHEMLICQYVYKKSDRRPYLYVKPLFFIMC